MPLALFLSHFPSLHSLSTSILYPLGADFCKQVGRILCVSPTNSPVRLGVSPTITIPTDLFHSLWFWVFSFLHWNPAFCGPPSSPASPGLVCSWMWDCPHSPPVTALPAPVLQLPPFHVLSALQLISTPPTIWLNVFLQLLGCWTSMQMFFWQFRLFLVFKLVVILLLIVQRSKAFLPTPPSWPQYYPKWYLMSPPNDRPHHKWVIYA